MDDILTLLGHGELAFEDLSPEEKETYLEMANAMSEQGISVIQLKDYLQRMLTIVEEENAKNMTNTKEERISDIMQKARIINYRLLLAFLDTPAQARRHLESMTARKIKL